MNVVDVELPAVVPSEDLLAIDEALENLAAVDAQAAELVKLRYFAGLTQAQIAAAFGVSRRTADNIWAFAKAWIASRQPGKGLARRALAQELRRKGIDDEVARDALDEIDPDDEREAGRRMVRRKLRSLERFDDQTKTRRLVGMLARKGYGAGVAFSIVREELALADDDGADGLVSESDL